MTEDFETACNIRENPIILLQSDWDDLIFTPNREIWISANLRGKDSVHSMLKSQGTNLPICISDDFSVTNFSQTIIEIRHNQTGQVFVFVAPLKTFSKIHTKKILALDATGAGLGVSACTEDKLIVWNAFNGEIKQILSGHLGSIYKCKFFPSGKVVLSAGADMKLKIWSAETGDSPVTLIGHTAAINDFCIVDKGRNIISVSKDGSSKLWDCGNCACLATLFVTNNIFNCCTIGLLPQFFNPIREEPINSREVGTNNKLLLIGSDEGYVYGIGIHSRKKLFTINASSAVNKVLMLNEKIIIGCQNGTIKIYTLPNIEAPVQTFCESTSPVLSGCTFKDYGFFVGRNDGTVTYFDCLKFLNKRISLTGSDFDPIYDISCANNNKIYTCCRDGKIRQYAIGEAIAKFYKHLK